MNHIARCSVLLLWFSVFVAVVGCGDGHQSNPGQGLGPPPPPPPPLGGPTVMYLTQIKGTGKYQINLMSQTGVIPVGSPDRFNYVYLSPDGKKIVYSLADVNGFYFSIGIMNSDGSGKTTLTGTAEFDLYPQFTPDGSKIIYESWSGRSNDYIDLILMNVDGTDRQNLTNQNGNSYFEPTISPDGKTIAAWVGTPTSNGLATMNIDGSGLKIIANGLSLTPAFSADGTKILFSSGDPVYNTGNYNIYAVNVDGTNLTQLTSGNYDWCPIVVGDQVVFVSSRDSKTHGWYDNEMYVMNPDGSGITRLTNNTTYDGFLGYAMFGIPG